MTNTIKTQATEQEIIYYMDNCDLTEEEAVDFITRNNEYTVLKQALKQELLSNGYDEDSAEDIAEDIAFNSAFNN